MNERFLPGRWPLPAAAVLVLSLSGCLATRSDVRILQDDIRLVRSEAARDDSIRAVQIARLNDSLAAVSRRLTLFRGEVDARFVATDERVLQSLEMAGQSQRRVQEMRATLETARVSAVDTSAAAPAPGPNQLYELGRDQFMRGSNAAARAAFQDLLNRFPDADVADDAQFHVAETFNAEGNPTAADSVYALVASQYPRSPRTPTALYKRGVIAQNANRTADARRYYNEVINRFPRTDEAMLARDRLRSLR